MTDREIADLVNRLRDIAIKFHDAQQLRERIAHEIRPLATQMREYRNQALEEAIEHFNLSSETWEGWEVAAFLKGLVK